MKYVDQVYINGKFKKPHGTELFDLFNPATKEVIGKLTLGDVEDIREAIAAAKTAFKTFSKTTVRERQDYLRRLAEAVNARGPELTEAMIEEYGAPVTGAEWRINSARDAFTRARELLETFEFKKKMGKADVVLEPLGVVGIITPWNSNAAFICGKLAMVIASGSTTVIKPSEMSGLQTQILMECLDKAGLPPGVFNIVNGRGDVVGNEISQNSDIAKISFTGSSAVGKTIARIGSETLKRVTLELGGKSPNIILDDADFSKAIPLAVQLAFINNSQACIAGTRVFIPEHRLGEVKELFKKAVSEVVVGDPRNTQTTLGPLVSQKQYERVQYYIQKGLEEGAELLIGGPGHPDGLEKGYYARPTVFVNVKNTMTIAREEIFGPVISVITYKTIEEVIEMANDTIYGLHGYVSSGDKKKGEAVASQIQVGRVFINGWYDEPLAPVGGFKQSGIGREFGSYGLEEYLEPKTIMGN